MTDAAVSWSEAAVVAAVCWAVDGVGYGVLAVLDEPTLPVAPLIAMGLVHWFWASHRIWPAAVLAGLAGAGVLFVLVDALRPPLGRYGADALATGIAATAALVVFTLASRTPALCTDTQAAGRRRHRRDG